MDKCRKCGKMFKGIGRLCPECQLEVDEKIDKGLKLFKRHGFDTIVTYDYVKACYESTNSVGRWISYNGENWIQVVPAKSLITHLRPNPALEADTKGVELSDEYQHNHLQEAMEYALKEKEYLSRKAEGSVKNDSDKLDKTLTTSQKKIAELVEATKDLLLYKNEKYGDSALHPIGIFTKHLKNVPENTASILVRLDDKLGRVRNADSLRTNDVSDIIGYCTLLLISMGVTAEDIAKFKD